MAYIVHRNKPHRITQLHAQLSHLHMHAVCCHARPMHGSTRGYILHSGSCTPLLLYFSHIAAFYLSFFFSFFLLQLWEISDSCKFCCYMTTFNILLVSHLASNCMVCCSVSLQSPWCAGVLNQSSQSKKRKKCECRGGEFKGRRKKLRNGEKVSKERRVERSSSSSIWFTCGAAWHEREGERKREREYK